MRIRRETGPLLRRERHRGCREEESDTAHGRGTGNLPTPQDSSFPEEARRAAICRVSGLGVKALQPETVSDRQALRVQLPFTEGG